MRPQPHLHLRLQLNKVAGRHGRPCIPTHSSNSPIGKRSLREATRRRYGHHPQFVHRRHRAPGPHRHWTHRIRSYLRGPGLKVRECLRGLDPLPRSLAQALPCDRRRRSVRVPRRGSPARQADSGRIGPEWAGRRQARGPTVGPCLRVPAVLSLARVQGRVRLWAEGLASPCLSLLRRRRRPQERRREQAAGRKVGGTRATSVTARPPMTSGMRPGAAVARRARRGGRRLRLRLHWATQGSSNAA